MILKRTNSLGRGSNVFVWLTRIISAVQFTPPRTAVAAQLIGSKLDMDNKTGKVLNSALLGNNTQNHWGSQQHDCPHSGYSLLVLFCDWVVFSDFPHGLLTSHLGFSSPRGSIFRSDNRHVGGGGAWVFLHSNCLFHHFLRLLHHCYWCLVTGALFLKKQAKENKLTFNFYHHALNWLSWLKNTFYPTTCKQRDSEKEVLTVSKKHPATMLVWLGSAQ